MRLDVWNWNNKISSPQVASDQEAGNLKPSAASAIFFFFFFFFACAFWGILVPLPWVGKIPWRRKWQPTSVFLPGEFHGPRSLVGYSPWGRKKTRLSDFTQFSYQERNQQRVKAGAQTTGPPENIQSSNFKQDTAMNFSQTAEYSRVYILDVHGTNRQNTCAPTTQFKKKEIVKLWKPSIHRREEPRSWIWCQSLAFFFFFFNLTAKSVTEIKLRHTHKQNN